MRVSQAARWLGGGISILTLACGGSDKSTGPGPSGGKVSLDASRAASDSIGVGGGTITATSGSGVRYTLLIPAGALESKVKITLTPITDVKSLPVSGGFAAGADFQPAGLHFALPARLSVSPVGAAPSGAQLIALTFEGDADSLGLTPVFDSSGTEIVFLTHFSGASFVFGTTADLSALAQQNSTASASQPFINQLSTLGPLPPAGNAAALPILQQWFSTVILPGLQGASSDAELILAVGDYDQWATYAVGQLTGEITLTPTGTPVQPPVPASLATEVGQAATAAAPALRNAIAGNDATCLAQRNLQAMLNELFWQGYASYFHVATTAQHLDRATVIANLCGEVRLDSSKLVDPLPAGQGESFDMVWGVLIGHSPPVIPVEFSVTVTATGATVAPASGLTGPNPQGGPITKGFFTTVVNGNTGATANLSATACLIPPGETDPIPDLCHTEIVTRQVTGTCSEVSVGPGLLTPANLPTFENVEELDGGIDIGGGFSTLDLPCLRIAGDIEVSSFGGAWQPPAILRMESLTSLAELDISLPAGLKTVVFPSNLNLFGLQLRSRDISSLPHIGNVDDTLTFGTIISMQSLPTLTIGNITAAGSLSVDSNTVMSTLTLGNVTANQVDFSFNPTLSTLTTGAIKTPILFIQDNSSLGSLSGISSSSVVEDFEFVLDNNFSEDAALAFANRITVTGGVCQLTTGGHQVVKCYQGPPWH
jgi:hypothetical protein